MAREFTNKILELVDEGVLDARQILRDALCYMSEADVEDLYRWHCEGLEECEGEEGP